MGWVPRHAIVTGASGGIGRALCSELLGSGARVTALDIDGAALRALSEDDASGRLATFELDITDPSACGRVLGLARDRSGSVDLLINNAGITHFSRVADVTSETVEKVMTVNFLGAVHCTKAVLPDLLEARGQVVVLSSVAGFAPLFGRCAYVASKHALEGFFETLRAESREQGLGVLIVRPSFIASQRETPDAASPYAGTARPGSASATVGEVLEPAEAAHEIMNAITHRSEMLLLGRVARQSYWARRIWPGLYDAIMVRRARAEVDP